MNCIRPGCHQQVNPDSLFDTKKFPLCADHFYERFDDQPKPKNRDHRQQFNHRRQAKQWGPDGYVWALGLVDNKR